MNYIVQKKTVMDTTLFRVRFADGEYICNLVKDGLTKGNIGADGIAVFYNYTDANSAGKKFLAKHVSHHEGWMDV